MSAGAAIAGLAVLAVLWCAIALGLGVALAATGRKLAALQAAVGAHHESPGTTRDDIALYSAAGIDVFAPPAESRFVRGERFRW